jgi:phosphoglycolate phosphatase-like HAD superfamily hydrolase
MGIIFDLDGTLTEPGAINFQTMYERCGLKRSKERLILFFDEFSLFYSALCFLLLLLSSSSLVL